MRVFFFHPGNIFCLCTCSSTLSSGGVVVVDAIKKRDQFFSKIYIDGEQHTFPPDSLPIFFFLFSVFFFLASMGKGGDVFFFLRTDFCIIVLNEEAIIL